MTDATAMALAPIAGSTGDSAEKCSNCNSNDHLLYHTVCVRSNRGTNSFRRYCTSCVLKTHKDCFCPSCFSLHSDPNSSTSSPISQAAPVRTLSCLKCKSHSHFSCVPSGAPKSPYLCPPCSTPNYKYFDVRKPSSHKISKDGGDKSKQYIDLRLSKVLVLAAKIAANSLANSAKMARQDADNKVKIAALARKRAREALENMANMWAIEKEKILKQKSEGTGEVPITVSTAVQKCDNTDGRGLVPANGVGRQQNGSMQQNGGVGGVVRRAENVVSPRPSSGQKLDDGNDKTISGHVTRPLNNGGNVYNQPNQSGKGSHYNASQTGRTM